MRLLLVIFLFCLHTVTYSYIQTEEKSAEVYNGLCWRLRNTNPDQAKEYGLLAIAAALQSGNKQELIRAYSFTGVAYRNLGYYEEALRYYSSGLDLALQLNNKEQQCYSYINLANLHIYLNKPQKAEEQLKRITGLVSELDDPDIAGYYHLNLGRVYTDLHSYNDAVKELKEALSIRTKTGNKNGQGVCHAYLGDTYLKVGNMGLAEERYLKALELLDPENEKGLLSATLIGLANAQLATGQMESARSNALKALLTAREIKSLLHIKEASRTLADIYRKMNDFVLADQYMKDVITHTAQLYTEDLQRQTERFSYTLKNRELEYEKEKLVTLHREQSRNIIFLAVGILVLLLLFASLLFYRKQLALKNNHLSTIREQNQLLEEKVNDRTIEINAQKVKLEELSRFKESLTQMIAHDLRNQIGIILRTSDTSEGGYNLRVRNAAFGMLQMINNMIDVQMFEDAVMTLDTKPVALKRLMESAIEQIHVLREAKRIEVRVSVDPQIAISGDENILLRVFVNLMTNGIRHSTPGSCIEITSEKMPRQNRVTIGIHDRGTGIHEDYLPHIFEKYWYAKNEDCDVYAATPSGMGLAFCKLAVEAHKGSIYVESKLGQGSSFFFDLEIDESTGVTVTQPGPKKIFVFNEEEKVKIQAIVDELKSTPIYQVSTIKDLISNVEAESTDYQEWTKEILKACYSWDEQHYQNMLTNI